MDSFEAPETSTSLVLHSTSTPVKLIPTTTAVVPPPPGTALVRVVATPLQSDHASFLAGKYGYLSFPTPFVPGQVAVGRVLAPLPPDSAKLRPGDLVFVDSFVRARDAPNDVAIMLGLHDGETPAQKRMFAQAWRDGTWREVVTVPLENCHVIDEAAVKRRGLRPRDLLYISRLIIAKGGMRATGLGPGKTVAIGPSTGQFSGAMVELASAMGCHVIALGRSAEKLRKLQERVPRVDVVVVTGDAARDEAAIRALLPASSPGLDAFVEYSPPLPQIPDHVQPGMAAVRPRGHVAFMGVLKDLTIPATMLMFKNITIKGQYMYEREDVAEVIGMIEAGVVEVGEAAGHRIGLGYKLEDWEKALRDASAFGGWGEMAVFALSED